VDRVRLDAVEAEGPHLAGLAVGGAEDDGAGPGGADVVDLDGADGLGAVGLHVGDGDGVAAAGGAVHRGEGGLLGLVLGELHGGLPQSDCLFSRHEKHRTSMRTCLVLRRGCD
jgi:hypothetical protein